MILSTNQANSIGIKLAGVALYHHSYTDSASLLQIAPDNYTADYDVQAALLSLPSKGQSPHCHTYKHTVTHTQSRFIPPNHTCHIHMPVVLLLCIIRMCCPMRCVRYIYPV